MEQNTLALSGTDNVGKSTQLRILARRFPNRVHHAGAVHDHDPRWPAIMGDGLAHWWFEDAPLPEFAALLADSYLTRHRGCSMSGLNLIDRGIPMLEATIAATVAVRERLDHRESQERAVDLLAPYALSLQQAEERETGIILLHSFDPGASARTSLAREKHTDERYRVYQRCLAEQIQSQVDAGRYEHVIVADRPIMPIQAEIRRIAAAIKPELGSCNASQAQIIGFGGMSESGKSTAAAWMQTTHGFTRLKIGYLLDQAATIHGIDDIYSCDPTEQAELLVDSLDRFASAHPFSSQLTIESLHRLESTSALKTLLGNSLRIVYVDAEVQVRRDRGVHGAADVIMRDMVKGSRGASAIREIADVVVDNNGSVLSLRHQLDRLRTRLSWAAVRPRITPVKALALPIKVSQPVAELVAALSSRNHADLIAVTGSGGRGKYQDGWSDVDVLVIAGSDQLQPIREAATQLRDNMPGVKLGLTVITTEECDAGALTPRLVHVLRQIGTGEVGVQWCRSDLHLPLPPYDDDERRSLFDGTQAAVEIRRQLIRSFETRSLFKTTALLAKVILRATAVDLADDEAALKHFAATYLTTALAELVIPAKHDREACSELAEAVMRQWLSTLQAGGDPE